MIYEVPERRIQPVNLTRNEIIILYQTNKVCPGEPDGSIEDPNLMEIIRTNQEVIRPTQIGHQLDYLASSSLSHGNPVLPPLLPAGIGTTLRTPAMCISMRQLRSIQQDRPC